MTNGTTHLGDPDKLLPRRGRLRPRPLCGVLEAHATRELAEVTCDPCREIVARRVARWGTWW